MVKTYQGTIYPWNCDHMGHMNVKFYVEKFDEAIWNLFFYLGLTSEYLRDNNRGMVALEQNIKYHKELLAGDVIFIESEVLEIKGKIIRIKHYMCKLGNTKDIVSETEITGLHIDTIERKGISIPDFVNVNYERLKGTQHKKK